MAEIPSQIEAPLYESGEPLYPQNNQALYEQPIQGNQTTNAYGTKVTYKSPTNFIIVGIVFTFLFFGTFGPVLTIFISIRDNDSVIETICSGCPIFFAVIAFFLGSRKIVCSIITISPTLGIIEILRKKSLCCFNKQEVIQINNVREVIIRTDPINRFKINKKKFLLLR